MNDALLPAPAPRVVLALGEGVVADELFDLGAVIARAYAWPLIVRVGANVGLHVAAELPFVKQIDVAGVPRAWTPRHAQRARIRAARHCTLRLQALSREFALDARLEEAPGASLASLLSSLRRDVLVLGSPRTFGAAVRTARIGVVCRDGARDAQVLSTGQALADKLQGALHVLFARDTLPPEPDPRTPRITCQRTLPSLAAVVTAARAARVQVLVLSRSDLAPEDATLQEFLARPGRVVVVLP